MTSGRSTALLDGITRGRDGLQWPVVAWKSPGYAISAPTEFPIPKAPVSPFGIVRYTHKNLVTELGYVHGDHIVGPSKSKPSGANDGVHLAWIDAKQQFSILSGHAANAHYWGSKATGVGNLTTPAKWQSHMYGAGPLLRYGNILKRGDVRYRQSFGKDSQLRIVRHRVNTPWTPGVNAATLHQFDLRLNAHTDEVALIELWGRCIQPNAGFECGQETVVGPGDFGAGGGEVFYNGATVGYSYAAGGFPTVNPKTSALENLTPANWVFQLRCLIVSDAEDILDPRTLREPGNGIVAFWRSRWMDVPPAIAVGGQRPTISIPENFSPALLQLVLRFKTATPTSLWSQNDQLYSMHSGYAGIGGLTCYVIEGRKLTLAWGDALSYLARDGTGAPDYLYQHTGQVEFQFRAIG